MADETKHSISGLVNRFPKSSREGAKPANGNGSHRTAPSVWSTGGGGERFSGILDRLRGSRSDMTLSPVNPYLVYNELDFDIPVLNDGNCLAQYYVA